MTVFYRGTDVDISDRTFRVGDRAYALDALTSIHVVRPPRGLPPAYRPHLVGGGALFGGVAAAHLTHLATGWVTAVAVGAISALLGGSCLRVRPQPWLLRASHHGAPVTLYETADRREFGRVRRALARARAFGEG